MKHFLLLLVIWISCMFIWYQASPYTREYIRIFISTYKKRIFFVLSGTIILVLALFSSVFFNSVSFI